ncbi:MAG: hypothetical protein KDD76_05620, partial [Rickettsiales bacterium]|nr:hypothetical protein [Rickettsiales bacterium]
MINFIHQSIIYQLFKGFGSFYELKYIIPTPAIIVMLLMFMRQFLSRPFFWLLLGFFLFALVMMPLIGSRGAFISTLVGLLFFAIARYTRLPRAVFIVIALYIPLIPATVMSIV